LAQGSKILKISLRELRAVPGQKIRLQFNESMIDAQMVKPATGELSLYASTAAVRLQGHIQTIVKLQCHTCLIYFFQALNLEINEEFVYEDYLKGKALSARDRELQSADFFETVPYYGEIDVSDIVFQAVNLAIPTYCSCGKECSGPPVYNVKAAQDSKNVQTPANTNLSSQEWTDPRWHNLKTILPKDNKSGK
jgi:uncharacterized metal-binding protein YceD (DUF177 family)